MHLGTLADGLGCFPFDYGTYLPQSDCLSSFIGIRSLVGFGKSVRPPSPFSALPPINSFQTLYLNIFRGEPAISEFD